MSGQIVSQLNEKEAFLHQLKEYKTQILQKDFYIK